MGLIHAAFTACAHKYNTSNKITVLIQPRWIKLNTAKTNEITFYLKTIKRAQETKRKGDMVIKCTHKKTVQRWSYNKRTSHRNVRLHNRIRYAREKNMCLGVCVHCAHMLEMRNDAIKIRLKFHTPKWTHWYQ